MKTAIAGRNSALDALTALVGTGHVKVYTGTAPTHPEDSATGTLLVTIDMTAGWGAAISAVSSTSSFSAATTVASGTAGYFRVTDAGGTVYLQGGVSATGGGATMTFDVIIWTSGGTVNLTSFDLTLGEGTTT